MIKRVGTCHPPHGFQKFEFKWGGGMPNDRCWHMEMAYITGRGI